MAAAAAQEQRGKASRPFRELSRPHLWKAKVNIAISSSVLITTIPDRLEPRQHQAMRTHNRKRT